jgi:hypothetical protein
MGWYINYEIEINGIIDWDDEKVKNKLANYNCSWLYLRDMYKQIVIFSIYSQHDIEDIVIILKNIFNVDMIYKQYQIKN